jgi:transcriptional regulator with XRE-family HTH domain
MSERTKWSEVPKPKSERAVSAAADEERVTAFRELVYRLRSDAGLTQAELAHRMGTTQSAIARMENGGSRPTLETLERLAGAVGQDLVVGVETDLRHDQSVVRMVEEGHAVLRIAS